MASRHLSRSIVLQSFYEWDFFGRRVGELDDIVNRNIDSFAPGLQEKDFIFTLIKGINDNIEKITESEKSKRIRMKLYNPEEKECEQCDRYNKINEDYYNYILDQKIFL